MEILPILEAGREVSHLALRYDAPPGDLEAPFCFLYLHGFGSEQSGEKAGFFRASALAAGLPFCSFDFQGHGLSGGTMRGLTPARNLADVERARDYLAARGHERLCLIGSSMGGATALWYAAAHPRWIAAGLHIAPAVALERGLAEWAGVEGLAAWRATGSVRFTNDHVSCDLGWELMEGLREQSLEKLLPRYRTPTLLLQGKQDDSVDWRDVVRFATECRGERVELHLFADGDHRLTDRKERLWALMLEFLRGRSLLPAA